ncbi:MAG: Y4yA family PLP-dependent enzyme [Novipirellula sp. JB048]
MLGATGSRIDPELDHTTPAPPIPHDPGVISDESLRSGCRGELPLTARLEPWMTTVLQTDDLTARVERWGSPLNVICTSPMSRNIKALRNIAAQRELDFQIFFARKSNKCLSLVDQALASGIGVDTASENEVRQCFARGAEGKDLLCTAAIKSESLLKLCIANRVEIAVDNRDELSLVLDSAKQLQTPALIALRLGGFHHRGEKLPTRFGFDIDRDRDIISRLASPALRVAGVQFHLDGYDAAQRVSAIGESLAWIDRLREAGHAPTFLDMGGGFPISYLEDETQWESFWQQHQAALRGERAPLTYRHHGLGLLPTAAGIVGRRNTYPYYQSPTQHEWLASVLDAFWNGRPLADHLRHAGLQLRCEPGRSLLDGCGMTLARVEFRKQNAEGDWLIGLSMNRTQCRTSSDDFLVDPLLVRRGDGHSCDPLRKGTLGEGTPPAPMSGFLVGAYCTESELLSLRRLHFPRGVQRGDWIVFPNTAGYFMHFLESRSHQFPLAKNVIHTPAAPLRLDPIDQSTAI